MDIIEALQILKDKIKEIEDEFLQDGIDNYPELKDVKSNNI